MNISRTLRGLLMTLLLVVFAADARAAQMQSLIQDLQRLTQKSGQTTMVFWLPQQYWQEMFDSNPALNAQTKTDMLKLLEAYTLVIFMRGKINTAGQPEGEAAEQLFKNTRLQVNGRALQPLAENEISANTMVLLANLRPVLAAGLGQFGQQMHLAIFSNRNDGKPLLDASQSGNLNIKVYDEEFRWRLPLGSLLPEKRDSKTGEAFPGNYNFNPYTGEKLAVPKS